MAKFASVFARAMFALPTDMLACVFQQLVPTADQVVAAEDAGEATLTMALASGSSQHRLRQPEDDAFRDEDDQEFEMEMDEEDEEERMTKRTNALKRAIDADVVRKIDVVRHVLACALVSHSGHDAVRAWMQNLTNGDAPGEVAVWRIRLWQTRTDSILVDVLARPLRTDSIFADGVPSLQGFADGLYSTLRSTLRSLPVFEAAVAAALAPAAPAAPAAVAAVAAATAALAAAALAPAPAAAAAAAAAATAVAAAPAPAAPASAALLASVTRLHLRRPAAEAFVLILESDVIRLLAAAMRVRIFRMQDEEEDPRVESRDIIFCIKERMDTHDGNGASSVTFRGCPSWMGMMPLWLILPYPFDGDRQQLNYDDLAIITEQLVAAGPTLEVQLAIVQRLAARAGIKRFSGDATKLIWQYVSLQAAALLLRAATPVRDLIFPQRKHKKRVEDGLSEASQEEEEMSSSDEQEMNHEFAWPRHSGSEESDSEQGSDVEEGDDCDARWDEEESEWVMLPSTACFEGAAGWLRDGLRPRTLFYLGLPEKVSKSTEEESPESLLNRLQL